MNKTKRKKLRIKELKRQGYSCCDIGRVIMNTNIVEGKRKIVELLPDSNGEVVFNNCEVKVPKKSLFTRFIEFVVNIYNKIFKLVDNYKKCYN